MVAGTRRCAAMHKARSFFLYSDGPVLGLRQSTGEGTRLFLYRARGPVAMVAANGRGASGKERADGERGGVGI